LERRNKLINEHEQVWNVYWWEENERFESFITVDLNHHKLSGCMCFVWDGNQKYKVLVWMPYIKCIHGETTSQYISMDSIMLDMSNGLVEFFT
jgi:hypothetical protein